MKSILYSGSQRDNSENDLREHNLNIMMNILVFTGSFQQKFELFLEESLIFFNMTID